MKKPLPSKPLYELSCQFGVDSGVTGYELNTLVLLWSEVSILDVDGVSLPFIFIFLMFA